MSVKSTEIDGDESVPYESWKKYEEAVVAGVEQAPEMPKERPNEKYAFVVDEALDSIDLTFNGYVPSEDALNFFNIVRLVMGEDPEVDNGLMHYFLVDLVYGNIGRNNYPYSQEIRDRIRINPRKIAIIASRFSAKSTIITAFMPIVTAVTGKIPNFGDVMFWVSFGDSQQAGAKVQANTIRDICEDSKFCKDYFEKMRFTDEECEFLRKGDGPTKKRSFMFKTKGAAGGSVRGIRYKTERPQIFTFDDIIKNEADANSPIIMAKLRSMIYSDAENATGKKGKIIIVNTPFNKKDPVYAALESGVWTPVCIPICEKISLDLKREEYRGSWESMKSYEDIMERYEDAFYGDTLREFNQELMLRISAEEDKLIKDEHIQWYSRKSIMKNLGYYNLYMTTDLTASNSAKGDFSCTMLWALSSNNDLFLLDLSVKKCTIAEQYEPVFNMARDWGTRKGRHVTVGVEIDGQQQLNLHTMKKMMIETNTFFSFARQIGSPYGKEGISRRQATGAKHEQFMRVFPLFQQHKIYLPEELKELPDMKEVLNELSYITYEGIGSKHDDCGTYNTKVDTPTGYKLLGEIVDGDEVIGYGPLGSVVCKVKDARITGIKPIVNIEMEDGTVLRFSEFHPMLTDTGYRLARDITIGEKLVRNRQWKQQLNIVNTNGVENPQDTTNPRQDVQMEVERIGYTNISMKKLTGLYQMATRFLTRMKTNPITVLTTWSCLLPQNTKKNTLNKIDRMGLYLVNMSKNISMKYRTWLNLVKKDYTQEELKEESSVKKRLAAHTVVQSSHHIVMLDQTLNTVVLRAETLGIELPQNLQNAVTVENYSKLLVNTLQNVQDAELQVGLKLLMQCLGEYAKSAEIRSKVLLDKLTVEQNAQKLALIEHKENDVVRVKKIWMTKPEPTYNFEVEDYHNYQVEDGYVVHNCLDAISMLASMEMVAPSEGVVLDTAVPVSSIWANIDEEDDDVRYSTVF